MILTVATICRARTRLQSGSVASVIAGSTAVQRIDRAASTRTMPAALGKQIDPPGEGRAGVSPSAAGSGVKRRRHRRGCRILVDVVGVEPGHRHRGDARRCERHEIGRRESPPFAQPRRAGRERMGEDRALGFGTGTGPNRISAGSPGRRRRSVIWARIATAISAGTLAPMSAPIGAWIRAIAARRTRRSQPLHALGMGAGRAEAAD